MGIRRTEEFRNKAARIALTSGLSQNKVTDDLGIGLSTLSKWVAAHKHDELMIGSHDDKELELARLRKENRILREERDILKMRRPSSRAKAGEVSVYRKGEGKFLDLQDVQSPGCQRQWLLCLGVSPSKSASTR